MVKVRGIDHLSISVSDFKKSKKFYSGLLAFLGFKVLDEYGDSMGWTTYEAFLEAGGPYNKKVAKSCHDLLLSIGNTRDPGESYRKFRGRDPKVDALLRARGFPVQ
jgi:catechol 2,3-dioxygenase-like lactoylglutathione lyase family enzyme